MVPLALPAPARRDYMAPTAVVSPVRPDRALLLIRGTIVLTVSPESGAVATALLTLAVAAVANVFRPVVAAGGIALALIM